MPANDAPLTGPRSGDGAPVETRPVSYLVEQCAVDCWAASLTAALDLRADVRRHAFGVDGTVSVAQAALPVVDVTADVVGVVLVEADEDGLRLALELTGRDAYGAENLRLHLDQRADPAVPGRLRLVGTYRYAMEDGWHLVEDAAFTVSSTAPGNRGGSRRGVPA